MRPIDTSRRPVVVCVDACREDSGPLCQSLRQARLRPECYASILRGTAALGTKEVAFVLIDYAVANHTCIMGLVNLCHRMGIPVAVMVTALDQPDPRMVEEVGCIWLKDQEFLKIIPSIILDDTGLLPPTR